MFEIVIFCVIVFAIVYWTTLFIMGRREDVLHGQFVEADAAAESTLLPMSPVPPRSREPRAVASVASERSAAEPIAPAAVAAATQPPAMPAQRPANPEKLQSLLASLKQELKNAAQI